MRWIWGHKLTSYDDGERIKESSSSLSMLFKGAAGQSDGSKAHSVTYSSLACQQQQGNDVKTKALNVRSRTEINPYFPVTLQTRSSRCCQKVWEETIKRNEETNKTRLHTVYNPGDVESGKCAKSDFEYLWCGADIIVHIFLVSVWSFFARRWVILSAATEAIHQKWNCRGNRQTEIRITDRVGEGALNQWKDMGLIRFSISPDYIAKVRVQYRIRYILQMSNNETMSRYFIVQWME